VHEAAQELLALLQRPDLQDLAESPQVGQRVGRGGRQIDGLVFHPLQVGEAGLLGLALRPDFPEAFVDEVAVGRGGDVQEAVGLGLKRLKFALELADLLARVLDLGQEFLRDEPPQGGLAAPGQVLPEALLDSLQNERLEWVAAQPVPATDRFPLRTLPPQT
jgi:hypothetical protein